MTSPIPFSVVVVVIAIQNLFLALFVISPARTDDEPERFDSECSLFIPAG